MISLKVNAIVSIKFIFRWIYVLLIYSRLIKMHQNSTVKGCFWLHLVCNYDHFAWIWIAISFSLYAYLYYLTVSLFLTTQIYLLFQSRNLARSAITMLNADSCLLLNTIFHELGIMHDLFYKVSFKSFLISFSKSHGNIA